MKESNTQESNFLDCFHDLEFYQDKLKEERNQQLQNSMQRYQSIKKTLTDIEKKYQSESKPVQYIQAIHHERKAHSRTPYMIRIRKLMPRSTKSHPESNTTEANIVKRNKGTHSTSKSTSTHAKCIPSAKKLDLSFHLNCKKAHPTDSNIKELFNVKLKEILSLCQIPTANESIKEA